MDIKLILESEKDNFDQIRLYREGMFYRAYEYSAFSLKKVQTLKTTHKESKALGITYVSVGFPIQSLDKFIQGLTTVSADADRIVLFATEPVDPEKFQEWKMSVPLSTPQNGERTKNSSPLNGKGIMELLEVFDLSVHTPIECMVFLADIKSRMKKDQYQDGTL